MDAAEIEAMAARMQSASVEDPEFVAGAVRVLKEVLPERETARNILSALISADDSLGLVGQCLPGWNVIVEGTAGAAGGNWSCFLRESGTRDDDEVIGIGRARTPPLAILAALLITVARRARGYV